MKKLLLPILLLFVGLVAGGGAGALFGSSEKDDKSEVKPTEDDVNKTKANKAEPKASKSGGKSEAHEYLKLTKQFVVPVVTKDQISSLVTLSLSLETAPGMAEAFYSIEPKLRDAFLQVLFDHANMGGFNGEFTNSENLATLRQSLLEVAQKNMGDAVSQVLIMSFNRQDT